MLTGGRQQIDLSVSSLQPPPQVDMRKKNSAMRVRCKVFVNSSVVNISICFQRILLKRLKFQLRNCYFLIFDALR